MADKNIGLIVSSASSGISGVVADAKRLIPEGKFLEPSLWIRSSQTSNSHAMIEQWLKDIDYSNLLAGISDIKVDPTHSTEPEIFNLNGMRAGKELTMLPKGVYIVRQSGRTVKVKL